MFLTFPQDIKYQTSHQIVLDSVGQADFQVHFRCSDKPRSGFGWSGSISKSSCEITLEYFHIANKGRFIGGGGGGVWSSPCFLPPQSLWYVGLQMDFFYPPTHLTFTCLH